MKLTDFGASREESYGMDAGKDVRQAENRKKLFLGQVELLDTFLKSGAIDARQYRISYGGLLTKMKITPEELNAWERTGMED